MKKMAFWGKSELLQYLADICDEIKDQNYKVTGYLDGQVLTEFSWFGDPDEPCPISDRLYVEEE